MDAGAVDAGAVDAGAEFSAPGLIAGAAVGLKLGALDGLLLAGCLSAMQEYNCCLLAAAACLQCNNASAASGVAFRVLDA